MLNRVPKLTYISVGIELESVMFGLHYFNYLFLIKYFIIIIFFFGKRSKTKENRHFSGNGAKNLLGEILSSRFKIPQVHSRLL